MKRFLLSIFTLLSFTFIWAQSLNLVPKKVLDYQALHKNTMVYFSPFTVDNSAAKKINYEKSVKDVTVLKIDKAQLSKIVETQPKAMELAFPFEGKTIIVELIKNNLFTNDFKVSTNKGDINYKPGVYYQGMIKGDNSSVVAISFFNDDVVGVSSTLKIGNIVLGKAQDSEDFLSYNDSKLTGVNPFVCGVDELVENQKQKTSYNPVNNSDKLTANCVRVYYEVGYGPYTQNSSNVTTTSNWLTAMHNNISTLYANDGVNLALSEIFVWTTVDPYAGTPDGILDQFRLKRTSFNGDIAQLIRNPATTSIAYLNSLCTNYNYSYSGVNKTYSNIPTYSWNIDAMTHEMGHNLGSPHTHACAWNGNNSAIDGCGSAAGYDEGCDAELPTDGGTIMSYCHLVSSVGINFAKGFGPQPGSLIRNTIDASGCLGRDCIKSCTTTVTDVKFSNYTQNSVRATIVDNSSTNWKYKVSQLDGTLVTSGNSNSKVVDISGLSADQYYIINVGTDCSGPDAYQSSNLFLTDADWCVGTAFTDPGGTSKNYIDNQVLVKTFYPTAGKKLKLTFSEFGLEDGYDFMDVYDGVSISSPKFTNGNQLTGFKTPGPFEATNPEGAITVLFISDPAENGIGWNATFDCLTLATSDLSRNNSVSVTPNPTKGKVNVKSTNKITSVQIYDVSGKLITNEDKIMAESKVVNLSDLPAGNYLFKIKTEKETVVKKVLKN